MENKNRHPNVDDPRKRFKDHDLRICTWNVRTLNRDGATIQLANELDKIGADITAIQEMRKKGQGCSKLKTCDIYYSGPVGKLMFGCGFVVGKRLRNLVSRFTPVNERLAAIRIKAKFFNISLICTHAPTEEKDELTKDEFYDQLDKLYDRCPKHDIKIILGDFNAKIGKEKVFGSTVGNFSLHEETSRNGMRLIDFTAACNMVICSTRFQHLNIHKVTWISPSENTGNQIDHVVIDGRHVSSVLDVRTMRGVNIDSDHKLVAAKVRTRLNKSKITSPDITKKFDVRKLQSQQISRNYATRLTNLLQNNNSHQPNINEQWTQVSRSMRSAAEEVLGYDRPRRNQWYDEECRKATQEKNKAYLASLQHQQTRGKKREKTDTYREKRRSERNLFRRKKREQERREYAEIEMHCDRNEARKFFQKVKRQSEGYKCGTFSCKDKNGNLVIDAQDVLRVWSEHFSKLLGEEVNNTANGEEPLEGIISDDGIEISPPDYTEIEKTISRLKNNKAAGADGLSAELFKYGGEELVRCMHHLLCNIWSEERMPDDWNLSVLCPVLKKGDPTVCTNYRGISLLPIAYKVLSGVICERLKPYTSSLIGPYQCGFRPGKSTTDQIFTLRQIMEKTQEKQIDTHHLFVDYKAAFDSPIRDKFYIALSELRIPAKYIRLCIMTLRNTRSAVKIGTNLSEPFDTERGFRQGDALSCDFFNLLMERVLQRSGVEKDGIIYNKSVMLLAYADDIDIIGNSTRAVSAAFAAIEKQSNFMGLKVNEAKTKYFLSTSRDSQRLDRQVSINNHNFELVEDFVYLGTSVTNNNNITWEIKRRITLANRCYFGLGRQMRSRALSRRTKLMLYKSLILPVLLYGSESWTMTKNYESMIAVFERKILRKIFGPLRVDNGFRIRMNHELYTLHRDMTMDIVRRIKLQRLRWLGHVERMEDNSPAKRAFSSEPLGGKRKPGAQKTRWRDQVMKDLVELGVNTSNWRQQARNRNSWRSILDQV